MKSTRLGVLSKQEKYPKSTGERVRSKREKYTCLESCLSFVGGETFLFLFYDILSTHMSLRVSVRYKIFSAL